MKAIELVRNETVLPQHLLWEILLRLMDEIERIKIKVTETTNKK
jgi:hypothetical protein